MRGCDNERPSPNFTVAYDNREEYAVRRIQKRVGRCILHLLPLAAIFFLALCTADVSAAPLSLHDQEILREAADGRLARDRGQVGFVLKINLGEDLAIRLGRASDHDAIPFLLLLKDGELISKFAVGFQGPSTPTLESLIVQYRTDPIMGWSVLRLVKKNSSRALYEALLSDLRTAPSGLKYPYDRGACAIALLRTELPDVEGEVLELLRDPSLTRIVATFLVGRKYMPAEPVLFDLLEKMPASTPGLGSFAASAVKLNTQRIHDAAARKLIELGRDQDSFYKNNSVDDLIDALYHGFPTIKLSPLLLEKGNLVGFNEKQRTSIDNMVQRRAVREKMATELTPDNLANWISSGENDELVDAFIANHVDVNALTSRGRALNVAAFSFRGPMLKRLLLAGANPRLGDANGNTPMHTLAAQAAIGANKAWRKEQASYVSLLIAAGADVSAAAIDGSTPLHVAVRSGNMEVAEQLVESKADINAECLDTYLRVKGVTPLQLAIDLKSKAMEEYLRSKGATVSKMMQARRALATAKRTLIGLFYFGGY